MKTFAERLAAVESARIMSRYADTEELIEIFLDGDTVYAYRTLTIDGVRGFGYIPLQPKDDSP